MHIPHHFDCETQLIHAGRDPSSHAGMVNTPAFRGSTILSSSLTEWESRKLPGNPYASYGRFGTPTTRALETAVAALEGGHSAIVFPSGLAAVTHSLASDEILKNSLANYAFEHFEIAAYTSLITMAEQGGGQSAIPLLQQNLDEERAMAADIEAGLPDVVRQFIRLSASDQRADV